MAMSAGMVLEAVADASLSEVLAAVLEANERLAEELAHRDAELEPLNAELAVLQRLVSGRPSGRA